MDILDIHTHHPVPQPQGVVALCAHPERGIPPLAESQRYSVGIHPWDTIAEPDEAMWQNIEKTASRPEVVAIGESGVDLTPRGGPLFRQLQIFKRHIDLSERLRKPMVIHDVKGHDNRMPQGSETETKLGDPWIQAQSLGSRDASQGRLLAFIRR